MIAPASSATTKAGTSAGRMPAKVSLKARATAAAGLAKLVDDRDDKAEGRDRLGQPLAGAGPDGGGHLPDRQIEHQMRQQTPAMPPMTCAAAYPSAKPGPISPRSAKIRPTAGLKCSPESGPRMDRAPASAQRLCWKLAIPGGFEPPTRCLEGSCSIQLSYGTAAPRFSGRAGCQARLSVR